MRHVELHGVRISFFNQGAGRGLESSASNRRAVPPPQTPPREPSSDPPLNSRQKRSRERARKYYASKVAAAPQEQPAAPMHLEQAPAAFGADAPSTSAETAEQIAARNARAMAAFLESRRRDGGPSGDGCGMGSGVRRGGGQPSGDQGDGAHHQAKTTGTAWPQSGRQQHAVGEQTTDRFDQSIELINLSNPSIIQELVASIHPQRIPSY